jgi:thioredoxin-like negative regulator of GroEL
MTLTLHLSPDLEQYLAQEAQQSGLTLEALALQLLSDVVLKQRKTEAANLLQSWLGSEEKAEQQETGKYLIQALDEDRLSDRTLFPPELKGITW